MRFVDRRNTHCDLLPDESGLVLTNVSTRSSLTSAELWSWLIATGFGPTDRGNVETIGPRASGTCTGVASDPVATPDCTDSFEAKDDDVAHAPLGVYTPKITMDITVVGKVTATDSFHARGDTYLGDRVATRSCCVASSSRSNGYEASEPYGPEIPIGTDADGSIITTRFVRARVSGSFPARRRGTKQTVISARFNRPLWTPRPVNRSRSRTPSGGTIHVATKALGRVNGGALHDTELHLIVQGRTPTSGPNPTRC